MKHPVLIDILGTKITVVGYSDLLSAIGSKVKKKPGFICVAAVHPLMESLSDKKLQSGMNKSLATTTDGMPLVWIAQSIIKRKVERIYGPELMVKICSMAQKYSYKIYLLGGFNGVSEQLKANLIKKNPALRVVGSREVPIRPIPKKQNDQIIKDIRSSKADIIFVGMGCPFQEKWMIENYKKFNKGVFVGVGAAFDFIAGRVKQAPSQIQRLGLEWLFRLFQEPRRLWKRYLITNFKFVITVLPRYKYFHEVESNHFI